MSVMYMDKEVTDMWLDCDDVLDKNSIKPLSNKGFCEAFDDAKSKVTSGQFECGTWEIAKSMTGSNVSPLQTIEFKNPFNTVPNVIVNVISLETSSPSNFNSYYNPYIVVSNVTNTSFDFKYYAGGLSVTKATFNWFAFAE